MDVRFNKETNNYALRQIILIVEYDPDIFLFSAVRPYTQFNIHSGVPRNFFWGEGCLTNSVEDSGSGGGSPLFRGSALFANE
jgi:hypothetical protein